MRRTFQAEGQSMSNGREGQDKLEPRLCLPWEWLPLLPFLDQGRIDPGNLWLTQKMHTECLSCISYCSQGWGWLRAKASVFCASFLSQSFLFFSPPEFLPPLIFLQDKELGSIKVMRKRRGKQRMWPPQQVYNVVGSWKTHLCVGKLWGLETPMADIKIANSSPAPVSCCWVLTPFSLFCPSKALIAYSY